MSLARVRAGVIKIARSCTSIMKELSRNEMVGTVHLAWHLHLRTGRKFGALVKTPLTKFKKALGIPASNRQSI